MDAESSTMVVRWSGRAISTAEYAEAHRDFRAFLTATSSHTPVVIMILVGRECPAPSAAERQRFVEAGAGLGEREAVFAFVTESTLARGVMTALRWLRPQRERHLERNFSTREDALTWIQVTRPEARQSFTTLIARMESRDEQRNAS